MKHKIWSLLLLIVLVACAPVVPAEPLKTGVPSPAKETPTPPETAQPSSTPITTVAERPAIATPEVEKSAVVTRVTGCSKAAIGGSVLLVSRQDKTLDNSLTPVDPSTGKPLCGYDPIPVGIDDSHVVSPDRDLLAVVVWRTDDYRDGILHLIDLDNWQDTATQVAIDGWVAGMAFSSDGKRLAIILSKQLIMVDVVNGNVLTKRHFDFSPRLVAFTLDGKSLVVYGSENLVAKDPEALLVDSTDLSTIWETAVKGVTDGQIPLYSTDNSEQYVWNGPAVVYSPKENKLFIVHADSDTLTTVNFTEQDLTSVDIHQPLSWLEQLFALTAGVAHAKVLDGTMKSAVLSPDGQTLYVTGQTNDSWTDENGEMQFRQTPLGLQVIDTTSGLETAHLETEATELAISQDGSQVYLRGWFDNTAWTDVVNAADLQVIHHLAGRYLIPAATLNGAPVLLSGVYQQTNSRTALAVVDPESFKDIVVWSAKSAYWLEWK